eukprot:10671625-Alexandrium_andersonii.AAC.1
MRGWRKSLRAVGPADERPRFFFTTQPRSATPPTRKRRTIWCSSCSTGGSSRGAAPALVGCRSWATSSGVIPSTVL